MTCLVEYGTQTVPGPSGPTFFVKAQDVAEDEPRNGKGSQTSLGDCLIKISKTKTDMMRI
jgi:hypothetical protein